MYAIIHSVHHHHFISVHRVRFVKVLTCFTHSITILLSGSFLYWMGFLSHDPMETEPFVMSFGKQGNSSSGRVKLNVYIWFCVSTESFLSVQFLAWLRVLLGFAFLKAGIAYSFCADIIASSFWSSGGLAKEMGMNNRGREGGQSESRLLIRPTGR